VQFLAVYVREAHPIEGWREEGNDRVGISIAQPRSDRERLAVAHQCSARLEINMPLVVDGVNDEVGHAYSGMPDRMYVIDRAGKVVYKSGRGPFGYKPGEMEQSLVMLLLDEATPKARAGRFPLLPSAAAWKRLPPAEKGAGGLLPAWARTLAGPLPRTTAGLLELDYVMRERSPLDARLRGLLRFEAARANRCAAGQATAAADLHRAGLGEDELRALAKGEARLTEAEWEAVSFARKMMLAADTVTDDEVARLVQRHGEKTTVAIVLHLAYAAFQDRLLLHLGLPPEEGGPLPPLDVRFRKDSKDTAAAKAGPASPAATKGGAGAPALDAEWTGLSFAQLQQRLEGQRARPARIRVPTWEELRKQGAPKRSGDNPLRIRWSLVCMGYQPELAGAWLRAMGTFGSEARQDRVFEESLFWVLTRSLRCFY
jgi:alkylhydroperoxidase family enzyme